MRARCRHWRATVAAAEAAFPPNLLTTVPLFKALARSLAQQVSTRKLPKAIVSRYLGERKEALQKAYKVLCVSVGKEADAATEVAGLLQESVKVARR